MSIFILINGFLLGLVFFFMIKKSPKLTIILKSIVVLYFLIAFVRFFLPDDFLLVINKEFTYGRFFDRTDHYGSILRWAYHSTLIVIPVAVFFPKNKQLKRVVAFYTLPMLILNILSYNSYMDYFLTREVLSIRYHDPFSFGKLSDTFRHVQFSLELWLALALSVYVVIDKWIFKIKNKKEILNFFLILLSIIVISLPIYVPQAFFGYSRININQVSVDNIIWLLVLIFISTIIYLVFRNQSYENRYITVLIMSFALFVIYNNLYMSGVTVPRLPIQLCNLACYLTLIALLFKWQKLFDFILVANVLGTLIAIALPDVSSGLFNFFQVHFILEHSYVFIIPIVIASLGIFKKPSLDTLKNSLVGFVIYFIFCYVSGTYLNSIESVTGYKVNYFYIFDTRVLEVFSFLSFTRNYKLVFGDHIGYPLYQFMIFLMFSVGIVGFYFFIMWMSKIADNHKHLSIVRKEQQKRKKLKKIRDLERQNKEGLYVSS